MVWSKDNLAQFQIATGNTDMLCKARENAAATCTGWFEDVCSAYVAPNACPDHMHATCTLTAQVYDVSKFLARHPGGSEQLMLGAGRDVTQLFESYHPFDVYK